VVGGGREKYALFKKKNKPTHIPVLVILQNIKITSEKN
jgi:hypothetical protein